jgi:hypothetical protein
MLLGPPLHHTGLLRKETQTCIQRAGRSERVQLPGRATSKFTTKHSEKENKAYKVIVAITGDAKSLQERVSILTGTYEV